jgi:hypothetical protein
MAASDSTFFLVYVGASMGKPRYAKISPQDAELVLKYNWKTTTSRKGRAEHRIIYASSSMKLCGKVTRIKMHRLIMNAPEGMHVDHINGDGLDNRRENLRIVTAQENQFNSRKHLAGHSVFKGVSWSNLAKKWRAYISPNRKQIHLGLFESEIEAAKAYDEKAKELFGPYAKLNLV